MASLEGPGSVDPFVGDGNQLMDRIGALSAGTAIATTVEIIRHELLEH
jgi:hypothetical protein